MKKPWYIIAALLLGGICVSGEIWPTELAHADGKDFQVVVDQNQLTMLIHEAPLVEVVERVAQTLFLTSHVAPGLEDTRVTLTIKDVPVRQGIDQLLANTNYVLTDRDLYVWARGGSLKGGEWRERQQVLSPNEPKESEEISEEELQHQAIYGEDPEARTTALEMLSIEENETVIPTLVQALRDSSPEVRGLALELLGDAEGPIPIDQISKIVKEDPNPEQRMEAIVVLASRDEEAAQTILQNALNDSDPEVAEMAKSILEDEELDTEFGDLP